MAKKKAKNPQAAASSKGNAGSAAGASVPAASNNPAASASGSHQASASAPAATPANAGAGQRVAKKTAKKGTAQATPSPATSVASATSTGFRAWWGVKTVRRFWWVILLVIVAICVIWPEGVGRFGARIFDTGSRMMDGAASSHIEYRNDNPFATPDPATASGTASATPPATVTPPAGTTGGAASATPPAAAPVVIPKITTPGELLAKGWDLTGFEVYRTAGQWRIDYDEALESLALAHQVGDEEVIKSAEVILLGVLMDHIYRSNPLDQVGWRRSGFGSNYHNYTSGKPAAARLAQERKFFRDMCYKARDHVYRDHFTTKREMDSRAEQFGMSGEEELVEFLREIFLSTKHLTRSGYDITEEHGLWAAL